MHQSARARSDHARTRTFHAHSDQARRRSRTGARGKHGLARARSAFRTCAEGCEPPLFLHVSASRALLALPRPLHCPAGRGRLSRALPAASGSSGCPSSDFWASSQVCRPFEPCFPAPRTLLATLLLPVLLNLLTHPTPPDDPSIDSAPLQDRRRRRAAAPSQSPSLLLAAAVAPLPSSSLPSLPPPLSFLPLSFLPPLSALTAVSAATALAAPAAEASEGPPPLRRCSPYSHHV